MADVGGNLNIESLQDTSKYDSQQKSIGGSISVGAGKVSGSLNVGRDKMHADYAAVNEQSGLNAGGGGFDIIVKGNTDLKGAVITSSAEKSKNQLTTGSLTVSDIKNHAEYNASSMGLGVGVGDVGKTVDGLMSTGGQVVPSTEKSGDGLKANTPIVLSASGNDTSTTHSAIATGKITITNEAQQQQLTGKTAEETVAGLNRDTDNTAGKLNNNFDKAQVEEAFTVTKAFINETSTFVANRAKEADAAKEKIKELEATREKLAQDPNATQAQIKAIDGEIALQTQAKLDAEKWGPGGTYGQAITVFQAAAGGNVTGGMTNLVQNAVVAYVQSLAAEKVKKIADSFKKDGKETADSQNIRTALHAIVGCAGAAATGQSCNSAAVGAASSVVLNNLISEIQKTDAEHMTAEQKENRKNLVGTLISGIVAAAGGDAAVANNAAQIEMENNGLVHDVWRVVKKITGASDLKPPSPEVEKILEKSLRGCEGSNVNACIQSVVSVRSALLKDGVRPNDQILLTLADDMLMERLKTLDAAAIEPSRAEQMIRNSLGSGVMATAAIMTLKSCGSRSVACVASALVLADNAQALARQVINGEGNSFGAQGIKSAAAELGLQLTNKQAQEVYDAAIVAGGTMYSVTKSPAGVSPKLTPEEVKAKVDYNANADSNFAGEVAIRPKDGRVLPGTAQIDTPIARHLIDAEIKTNKQGLPVEVAGGHNMDNFNQTLLKNGGQVIGIPKEVAPGIYQVEYRLPGTGKRNPTKTVYDPTKYSDQQMASMANEAVGKAIYQWNKTSNKLPDVQLVEVAGVKFEVPISKYNGKVYVPTAYPSGK